MDHDFQRRADLARDLQLRRELDEATPNVGFAGLVVAAAILITLGVVFLGPPTGDRAEAPSQTPTSTTAPATPPGGQ